MHGACACMCMVCVVMGFSFQVEPSVLELLQIFNTTRLKSQSTEVKAGGMTSKGDGCCVAPSVRHIFPKSLGPFFRGVSGQQCVFVPVQSWESFQGKGCGWACSYQSGQFDQREPLYPAGTGLGGPVCSWLAETSPWTQLPCRDPRASRRKLSLLHLTPDSQE